MNPKVDEYIAHKSDWSEELMALRTILLSTELEEEIKWGAPVYTVNGKNVCGLAAFKKNYGIWFFNGVFLKDRHKLLVNAQESTKAMRQIKFNKGEEIPTEVLRDYVLEAIENEKKGLKVAPAKPGSYTLSPYLKNAMDNDSELLAAFNALTPGKQKDYSNHISDAKQEKTKASRLAKIRPMILAGVGLHDKYKNC